MEDHDNAAGAGGREEIKSLKKDELAVDETTAMSGPVNKSGETQPSENINERGGESENASEPSDTIDRVAPDVTLVLIGDPASIEIGPKNILLDHDEQTNVEQFSPNLYNLCGRHVCVINMLGLQTKEIPLNQGVHAFVLLLPNTLHSSQYSSGVQWLEKAFGRGALSYLITVVTHETGETCESALKELKTNTDFNEKRFHTCNRSMMDEIEVANLLEKINVMVSENDPQSCSGLVCAENREEEGHLEHKSHEEERKDLKTNEREEDKEEASSETKDDTGTDVQQPENMDGSTTSGGKSEAKPPGSSPNQEREEDKEEASSETKDDTGTDVQQPENMDGSTTSGGKSEAKPPGSSPNQEREEDKEEASSETKDDTGTDVQQPENMDGSTTSGGKSEAKPPGSSPNQEREEDKEEASSETKDDTGTDVQQPENMDGSTTSGGKSEAKPPGSSPNQEREEDKEEASSETKDDTGTDVQQPENMDGSTTSGGKSEAKPPGSSPNQEREEDKEEASSETKDDTGTDVKQPENMDGSTTSGGKSEAKPPGSSPNQEKEISEMDISGDKSWKGSEDSSKTTSHQETEPFHRLHLKDKLKQKLSPADLLQIRSPLKQHHVTCEKDLPHIFLYRLMMLDYRARYIPVRSDSPEGINPKPVQDNKITENDFNDLDALLSMSADTELTEQAHVHPMDVQMAVFHCSDSFLKQMMSTKLSQCQYALPLLVPDPVTMEIECPLWTFREITKTWKVTEIKDGSNIVTMKSVSVCKAQTPLVSFFRLGSLSVSKSQLMNTLINDRHSTFFHRNCPGSTKSRYLMDGVAEIAWYCPAGKPSDVFNDCIAFCNLHGDALLIEKQRDILIEKSSVNIFFVASLQKNEKSKAFISTLFQSQKPLICLCVDDSCNIKTKNGKYIFGLKDRSQSDVSEELKQIIREVLSVDGSSLKPSFKLEAMPKLSGIKYDSDPACQSGKLVAMKIMDLLSKDNMDVSKIKDEFLPYRGDLWHQWSKIHKELYHLRGDIEKEKSKKQQELMNIRQKQCAASCSKLMKFFIESLKSLPPADKEHFLKWIQILMDDLATDDLSVILKSYDEKWSEVLALKNKSDKLEELALTDKQKKSDLLMKKQTELEEISKKLQSATFGLEHIFREMGQIYEAHRAIGESRHTDWSKYPELAAQLMISGHPMELMDGDAGHVPLTWISSLLEEVIKKLGDKRVFVLSVLGIQSSGKSTMLNTMFGLQFAVSAGRCTKGVFMQLLKVSEEMKKDLKFDYLLVVDTEGLRALELEGNTTGRHDNELATFVVGLGNLTLINIFGENPSEMQDILQIVVQAFMRMKKVKLSPSCVFVHQNVTDVAAAEKNMDGKRRLQEKLDQMAKLAAEEEDCSAECFSDVIEFDVQKDVKYCAQLWEGSPPMAPPNPGYSESIQEVKNTILSKASKSDGITLTQFKTNIRDLWSALLNENFVFSFKNTLEIAVYRKLEAQYANWTWALRSNMLTIENQLYNRIENGNLDKVEVSCLLKESNETFETIKKEMTTYFNDDKEKEMLAQWRGRFETRIEEFHDEQVSTVKRKLEELIQQKKARKKLDDKKKEFEDKLLQKSKELAQQLKDKAKDEEELQKQFSSVWSVLATELTADIKPIEEINLEEDQFTILQELGFEKNFINERRQNGRYKNISRLGDYSDYVKPTKLLGVNWAKNTLYQNEQQIISLIEKAVTESFDAIKHKPVAKRGYKLAYLQEVVKQVKQEVKNFLKEVNCALKKEFTVDLILYVFSESERWILDSQKKFKMNNDIVAYLESKETQYYNVFRSFCEGSSSAVVLAELICEKLKASTVEAVCNKTAIGLAGKMRCNFPAFNGNRLNLEKHVLKSLAENEDFDDFITYIRNPRRQMEAFIKLQVNEFIDHRDDTVNILKKNVEDLNTLVSQALFTATQKVQTQRGDTDMWLNEFSSLLKAVCTNTIEDHSPDDHSALFHRPDGIKGWHYRDTVEFSIDFCTTNVASDRSFHPRYDSDKTVPYKQYSKAGPEYANWRITPDESKLAYWKWFVCRFQNQLEEYYKYKFQGRGEIPCEWKTISQDEAIKSLDEIC
ncbi:interferon-induced very large GTPase 1 isoform X2 [Oreochromis niloticus]|uniref:interferon-induced very large GTPase 1 isoform X2 n=1 Tax=Oreochromis niloticus TaxID=8128 RepID=UPI000905C21A|nr:interferon-induced very large GTPase 1 isoform X2 [Oreochromis niloticus]